MSWRTAREMQESNRTSPSSRVPLQRVAPKTECKRLHVQCHGNGLEFLYGDWVVSGSNYLAVHHVAAPSQPLLVNLVKLCGVRFAIRLFTALHCCCLLHRHRWHHLHHGHGVLHRRIHPGVLARPTLHPAKWAGAELQGRVRMERAGQATAVNDLGPEAAADRAV